MNIEKYPMTTKIQQYFNNIAKCYDDDNTR